MTRFGLFLSSYAPLFAILAVRFTEPELAIACAVTGVFGIAAAVWILSTHGNETASAPIIVVRVEDVGDQAIAYLVTYLLPFVALGRPGWRDVIAYGAFFLVAALVYVRSDMVQINPTLYLLGRRITKVSTKEDRTLYAISSRRLLPGAVTGVELTPGIMLVTLDDGAS